MQKILVTGGAGYIGSHMVKLLLENNYEVSIIDNFSNSSDKNIQAIEKLINRKIDTYNFDLKDYNQLENLIDKQFDAIIHFAALKAVGESVEMPLEYYENNVLGTLNLLKFANKTKIKKFIFSSTAAVYGLTDDKPINEEVALKPESPYASSKAIVETILRDFAKAYGINYVALRYFNIAGNIESGEIGDLQPNPQNLVPALIMSHLKLRKMQFKVFGNDYPTRDGTGIRDYIHVSDLVDAHLKALDYLNTNQKSDIFNLGSGLGTSVLEVISAFERVTGEKVEYEIVPRRAGDVIFSTCDATKAKKVLGWEPKETIDSMISSMWKWYSNYFPR